MSKRLGQLTKCLLCKGQPMCLGHSGYGCCKMRCEKSELAHLIVTRRLLTGGHPVERGEPLQLSGRSLPALLLGCEA